MEIDAFNQLSQKKITDIDQFTLVTSDLMDPLYQYRVDKKRKVNLNDYLVNDRKLKKHKKQTTNNSNSENDSSNSDDDEIDPEELKGFIRDKLGDMFNKHDEKGKGKLNHIYFDSVVNKSNCRKLINQIEEINTKIGKLICDYDMDDPPKIYLHINSFGGSIFAAFNVIDAIRKSKFPIVTIIEGAAASAATLISVFGHERWITKHGYMLIHQLSSVCWGKMAEIQDEFENLKEITDRIMEIYSEKTQMKRTELRSILKHDRWWRAEDCLKKGLVDKII